MIKPQLVIGENNQVCMQLRIGQFTATVPLPEEMAGQTAEELQPFFDRVVPEMMVNLSRMHREHQYKLKRLAKRQWSTGSTKPWRSYREKIADLLQKT